MVNFGRYIKRSNRTITFFEMLLPLNVINGRHFNYDFRVSKLNTQQTLLN